MNIHLVLTMCIIAALWIADLISERYRYKIEIAKVKSQKEKKSTTELRVR